MRLGGRAGMAATLPTRLGPTADLVRAATRAGRDVEARATLAEGAFQALPADPAEHDRRVRATLHEFAAWADIIILAQASMARALTGDTVERDGWRVPALTSPRLGVEKLAREPGVTTA